MGIGKREGMLLAGNKERLGGRMEYDSEWGKIFNYLTLIHKRHPRRARRPGAGGGWLREGIICANKR